MKTLKNIEAELGLNVKLWGHAISRKASDVTVAPGAVQVYWVPAARTTEDAVGSDFQGFSNLSMCTWLPSSEE
eukprot:4637043-Pyramimonas_sp.AAC.1